MTAEAKKRGGFSRFLIIISLVILVNPNINTIDILPDFIAYFILALSVKRFTMLAPYFEEVREGLMRLTLVTVAKIPMMIVMFANMSSGSDIVTLMTLIFVALELIFLYPLIGNLFSALFYLGERTDGTATLKRFRLFGISTSPETVRAFAYVFVTAKGLLNLIPEFCLLSSTVDSHIIAMRRLYPILLVVCIGLALLLGIFALVVGISYVNSVSSGASLYEAAKELAGDKRLSRLDYERGVYRKLFGLLLLFIGAILLFDVKIALNSSTAANLTPLEITLLPRFLYAIAMMLAIPRLSERTFDRALTYISGAAYSVISIATVLFTLRYNEEYHLADLAESNAAKSAYFPIIICEAIELVLFIAMMLVLARVLYRFVDDNTGIVAKSDTISGVDIEYRRSVKTKAVLLAVFPAVIALAKFINCLLIGNPQYVFTDPSDISMPVIITSAIPWFGIFLLSLNVAYAFYAFYIVNELRSEVKLRYSDEESTFE